MARTRPSRGFEAREQQRMLLVLHALAMIGGLGVCAMVNRMRSPGTLWVQWVALVWFAAFCAHLWIFSRRTIATMGGARRGRSAGASGGAGSAAAASTEE